MDILSGPQRRNQHFEAGGTRPLGLNVSAFMLSVPQEATPFLTAVECHDPFLIGQRVIVKVVNFGWHDGKPGGEETAEKIHGVITQIDRTPLDRYYVEVKLDRAFVQSGYATPTYTTDFDNLEHELK